MFTTTRTNDQEAMRKVIADDAADRRKLLKLEAELEAVRPRWIEFQERIEMLCACYANNDRSYLRGVNEKFWRERELWLKTEIDRLAAARDQLTSELPSAITALKARVHRRQSIAAGDFGSWAVQLCDRLPQPLAAELTKARSDIQGMQDLSAIFTNIQRWIDRVGEVDALPAPVALLNVGAIVRRLAAERGES